jgi:hypothetical protein
MTQGFSIYFSPQDLKELQRFLKWKTQLAATAKGNTEMHFSVGDFDIDHSLDETTKLIAAARHELQQAKELKSEQSLRHAHVAQQRDSISTLDDRKAESQQRIWEKEAEEQAKTYADSVNTGGNGHAYITDEEKSIRDGVVSWIKRQKMRGHFGGQKALNKK